MASRIQHLFLVLILFTLIPVLAHAATFYPTNADDFQTALTQAAQSAENDIINLPQGILNISQTLYYPVPIGGAPGSLTILGPSPTNQTVLDGGGTCTLLNLDYWYNSNTFNDIGTTLTISNISFQNGNYPETGYQTYTGGAYIQVNYANVVIEDCEFFSNQTSAGGAGGLYVATDHPGSVTLTGCTFSYNRAYGYYESAGGATIDTVGSVTVTGCSFYGNTLYEADDYDGAGGLYLYSSSGNVNVSDNTFTGNLAEDAYEYCAGGAYVEAYGGSIAFQDNSLSNNSAYEYGGAYVYTPHSTADVSDNTFTQNSVLDGDGGGLYVYTFNDGQIYLTSNTFSCNTAFDQGGAAYVYGPATITNNMFLNNSAGENPSPWPDYYNGTGGALSFNSSTGTTITNNTFVANSAYYGGAVYGMCGLTSGQVVNVYNNIFWDNTTTPVAGSELQNAQDLLIIAFGSSPQPYTVNLFNNDYTDTYVDVIAGATLNEVDNISINPQLDGVTAHLTSTSPCIEMGLNTAPGLTGILVDIDGDDRIADNDGDGTATVDMGADEYLGVLVYYTLNASVSGGNGTISPTSETYPEDNEVTLTATPDNDYQVASWSGTDDDSSTSTINYVTMDSDKTVTVTFEPVPVYYTLTIDIPGGNGSVSLSPATGPYIEDSQVILTAIPADGYQLASWSGTEDDLSIELINTVTMNSDKTVTVTFEPMPVYYTLTVNTPDSNGTVAVSPASGPYLENTPVTLTATPNSGYNLASWSGTDDDSSIDLTNTVTMNSDKTVNVYFTEITYSLTVTSSGEGTLSVDPHQDEYVINSVVSIQATADEGWLFDHWNGDVADQYAASTTVTMDSDKEVNAVFTQIFYTLTMAVNGNGTVTPSTGNHSYASGEVVAISATPMSGWLFDHWEGAVADTSSASTTVAIDADKTVTAVFTQITYTLSTNTVGQGIIALSPPQPSDGYAENFTVQLGAIPADGWEFVGWSGDLSGTTNPVQLTMDSNKSVTATFTEVPPEQYALTVYTVGSGTISLNPAGGVYDDGTTVTLTAAPSAGYQFVSWFGTNDDSATTLTNTVTMNSARSVTITFEQIPVPEYTLSVSVISGQGSVSPAGGTYDEGTIVSVSATPATGWQFDGWNGDLTGSANPTNITMDSDKSVYATFSEIPPVEYTLNINTTGSGTVTVNPETGPYEEGTIVTITATPAADYMFDGWNGDVADSDAAETTVIMDADKAVEAVFVPDGDNDGVPTDEEQGPDGTDTSYDGNGDELADAQQANVVSGHAYNEEYITLASPADTAIVDTEVEELPESAPADFDFPYGLISFAIGNVTGGTSTMEIYLPEGQTCDTYYKYDEATDTWEEFLYDEATGTGAEIDGNVITLHFVDGGRGDQDGAADGVITDPGTPGVAIHAEEDDDSGSSGGGCFITTGNSTGMNPLSFLFLFLVPAGVLSTLRSARTR